MLKNWNILLFALMLPTVAMAADENKSTKTPDDTPTILDVSPGTPPPPTSIETTTPTPPKKQPQQPTPSYNLKFSSPEASLSAPKVLLPETNEPVNSSSVSISRNLTSPRPQDQGAMVPYKLKIQLNELTLLKKAAQDAGGDLDIIIKPKGDITAEDLIVPLAKYGCFEVQKNGDSFIVTTKQDSSFVQNIKAELKALEARRRSLLRDIDDLEKVNRQSSIVNAPPQVQPSQPTSLIPVK